MNPEKVQPIIYQFWTGTNQLTPNRLLGINSMSNIPVTSILLYKNDILNKILPQYPLHPIYQYLSDIHKSDYLRCYFMHHFGGGYADIKQYSNVNNWKECFEYINNNLNIDVIGSPEIKGGAAFKHFNTPNILKVLVACGYFIVRPHSDFSMAWWNRLNQKLDERFDAVKRNPAECPRDGGRKVLKTSKYPLRWAELMGETFHQTCYDFRNTKKVVSILKPGLTALPYK